MKQNAIARSLLLPALLVLPLNFLFSNARDTLSSLPVFPSIPAALQQQLLQKPPQQPPAVIPLNISGTGRLPGKRLAAFLLAANPLLDPAYIVSITEYYISEAAIEGINHDIAFAQMILETGFLRYGGVVQPGQNNFAGLGAINAANPGSCFATPALGIRAHIQHLKAYAATTPLNRDCRDLRFHLVKRGSASTLFALTGRWAADPEYGRKLYRLLCRLYNFPVGK